MFYRKTIIFIVIVFIIIIVFVNIFKYVLRFINIIIIILVINTFFGDDVFLLDTRLMLFQKVH